jgi:P-type Ca2+ transporter type 2C
LEIILFLAGVFLLTFIVGMLLEKFNVPWIFAALVIGLGLAVYNPFTEVTSSGSFSFLADLGMYFLLFIIGFELELKSMLRQGAFIIKTTAVIILAETMLGSLLVHYVFGVSWVVSLIVATSFSTVGEAVLLPILDEFRLVKTKLGQTILSIGVLDDFVEIVAILAASVLISRSAGHTHLNIFVDLVLLCSLFLVVFVLHKLHSKVGAFKFSDIHSFFLFVIFFIFLFIGIGKFVESAALGAILAGIALRNIIPADKLRFVDSEIRTVSYGLFAPIFFLSVGLSTDVAGLLRTSWPVFLVVAVTAFAKIVGSYVMGRKRLGSRESIIMGTSLMVKLSTSIVIVNILFQNGIIASDLYSVLIAATVIFTLVVPLILTRLIRRWKIGAYARQSAG